MRRQEKGNEEHRPWNTRHPIGMSKAFLLTRQRHVHCKGLRGLRDCGRREWPAVDIGPRQARRAVAGKFPSGGGGELVGAPQIAPRYV